MNIAKYIRAAKYLGIGVGTFLFDLLLLFIFVDFLGWGEVLAAAVAFLIAVTINYFFSQKYVFPETKRGYKEGYIIFIGFALFGMALIAGLMYLFVEVWETNYLISRVVIAGVVGCINYLNNLYLNFKVHKVSK